jgi:RHS repeat-associated protein
MAQPHRFKYLGLLLAVCSVLSPLAFLTPAFAQSQEPERPRSSHQPQISIPVPGGINVNTWNANVFYTAPLLGLAGRGLGINLKLSYNSSWFSTKTNYGYGWQLSHTMFYDKQANGNFVVVWEDGRSQTFKNNNGTYLAPADTFDKLVEYESGKYRLTSKFGMVYLFENPAHKKLTKLTDTNANSLTLNYDGNGQLTQITDASGRSVTLEYTNNRLVKLKDANITPNRIVEVGYDANENLTSIKDIGGGVTRYEYSPDHLLTKVTDTNGISTNLVYNNGVIASATSSAGSAMYFSYDATNLMTAVIGIADAGQHLITRYFYDTEGRIKKIERVRNALGEVISQNFVWDASNNITEFTDEKGNKTKYTYDSFGNLLTETNALNQVTTYTYEPIFNKLKSVKNAKNKTTTYDYDAKGNLIKVTNAANAVTNFSYDNFGNLVNITDAKNQASTFQYNTHGYQTQATNPLNKSVVNNYDAIGRVTSVVAPGNLTTSYNYDQKGNRISVTNPAGSVTSMNYDNLNQLTRTTDALGKMTSFEYDAFGHLTKTTDAAGQQTINSYDKLGNLTSVQDARGKITRYTYDVLGRLVSETDPDNKTTTYDYDVVGNLIKRTDASGNYATYSYDALNRVTAIDYSLDNTQDTSFSYDELGNLLSESNSHGSITRSFDDLNRLTSITTVAEGISKVISYTYDVLGNRLTMTDPDGGITEYKYDAAGRLTEIKNPQNEISKFSYDDTNRLIKKELANGTFTTYSYDAASRLTLLENKKSDNSQISSYEYTYDAVGNRKSAKTNGSDLTNYTYDNVYQLTEAAYAGGNFERFTYDSAGNRSSMQTTAGTINYTYSNGDRILTAGGTNYEWSNTGNLGKVGTTTYAYNSRNLLARINYADGSFSEYKYYPNGQRMSVRDKTGNTKYFFYDGSNDLLETNTSGTTQARYTSSTTDQWLSVRQNNATHFYLQDALGSTRQLIDSAQNVANTYSYSAFGNVTNQTGTVANTHTYTGRVADDSGLYYYRARYFDANSGRFTQKDPAGMVDGPNLYSYVNNSPLNFTDPTGLFINWYHTHGISTDLGSGFHVGQSFTNTYKCSGFKCAEGELGSDTSIGFGAGSGLNGSVTYGIGLDTSNWFGGSLDGGPTLEPYFNVAGTVVSAQLGDGKIGISASPSRIKAEAGPGVSVSGPTDQAIKYLSGAVSIGKAIGGMGIRFACTASASILGKYCSANSVPSQNLLNSKKNRTLIASNLFANDYCYGLSCLNGNGTTDGAYLSRGRVKGAVLAYAGTAESGTALVVPIDTRSAWRVDYFSDRNLNNFVKSLPLYSQNIDEDWGIGAPTNGINADDFSIRYSRKIFLSESGNWKFIVRADDGFRLLVNNQPVVQEWWEAWHDVSGSINLPAGEHDIVFEYFDRGSTAKVQLNWERDFGDGGVQLCNTSNVCQIFTKDIPRLADTFIGNDQTKSIKLLGNWTGTLFVDDQYNNGSDDPLHYEVFDGEDNDLANNKFGFGASSLMVRKKMPAAFTLYEFGNYGGSSFTGATSIPNLKYWGYNDQAESIKVASGYEVVVCEHANFHGGCGRTKTNNVDIAALNSKLRDPGNSSQGQATSLQVCEGSCPAAPAKAMQIIPANGVTYESGRPITLQWVGEGHEFKLKLSGGGLAQPLERGWSKLAQYTFTDLPASANPYVWQVQSWNPYGESELSAQWSFRVEHIAVNSLQITGANQTVVGQDQTYSSTTAPTNVTTPITYSWSPTPKSGQGTATAIYNWSKPGSQLVTVTTVNPAGNKSANFSVEVRCAEGKFKADYFNNNNLSNNPTTSECVDTIDSNWGAGGPDYVGSQWGTGIDGDLVVTNGQTYFSDARRGKLVGAAAVGQNTLTVYDGGVFTVGQEVMVIQMIGGATGVHDFGRITAKAGNVLTLDKPIANSYVVADIARAQVIKVNEYRNLWVDGTFTANAWDGDTGGVVVFRAQGDVVINGSIDMDRKGYRGGSQTLAPNASHYGNRGEGTNGPLNVRSNQANGNGGGGGYEPSDNGGAGGGYGTPGGNGTNNRAIGGSTAGDVAITRLIMGGGGGAAASGGSGGLENGQIGGNGGGIIIAIANNIKVSGAVVSRGGNGGIDSRNYGGGAGSGGTIKFITRTASLITNKLIATGGIGGGARAGGNGGDGRSRIEYCQVQYGSSTLPIISTQQISCSKDNFTIRYSGKVNFDAGITRFSVNADDGVRLWVDNNLVIDKWLNGNIAEYVDVNLSAGQHEIKLEYLEGGGDARVRLTTSTNRLPIISSSAPTTVVLGQVYQYQVIATDADSGSLTYQLVNAPNGMTINSGGLIAWTPNVAGRFPFEVTVSDGSGVVTQQATVVVSHPSVGSNILYLIDGATTNTSGNLSASEGTGQLVDTIVSAGGVNHDGTPANQIIYAVSNVSGAYQAGVTSKFNLYLDSASAGNGTQVRFLYDFTNDGTIDRTETFNYFATNDVANWELYSESRGIKSTTGSYADMINGMVKVELWNAIGSNTTNLRTSAKLSEGQQSKIVIPFTIGTSLPANSAPVIGDIMPQTITTGQTFTSFDLDNFVTDADNDAVTWTVSSAGAYTVNIAADKIAAITYANGWSGEASITFTASDGRGGISSKTVLYKVNPVAATIAMQPSVAPTISCPNELYVAQYFNTKTFSGPPSQQRCESTINNNWATGALPWLPVDGFSIVWTGKFTFAARNYTFTVTGDDGIRLWIDGVLVADEFTLGSHSTQKVVNMSAGLHDIRIEYYEDTGNSNMAVSWN